MNRKYADIISYVLWLTALIMLMLRMYLRNKNNLEEAAILESVAFAFLIGAVILRLAGRFLPKWFGNKPTREEIEEKIFGTKEN